ncbi:hypothetical protein GCM10011386_38260 [Parapedobacter defluvii]|uniref:DUF4393 domain-containing protein n=1 Tax=Parapedobacter defluvii TaxID=2045106 RepID=A0ABQ1ML36_9SPHI|nr:DUF2806 domain-containing protein [Parapedobacter defluvii]GGC42396.1 hypothetical protein GCM10011386_38260 [Parapedobacter defluvii]
MGKKANYISFSYIQHIHSDNFIYGIINTIKKVFRIFTGQKLEIMAEQTNKSLLELIKSVSIPEIIKNNAIIALANGLGKIISSGAEIPVAYFERISQNIKAKGNAEVKMINAAAESATKLFHTDNDLANVALEHFGRNIIKQYLNRQQVAQKTIENLQTINPDSDSTRTIDNDWLTQFWNLSETKTQEDVQEILSKILTKEIVNPGSISPYTLQLLSILTSDIGNSFQRLCNLSIDDGRSCYIIHPNVFPFQNIGPLEDYEISYDDLFDLDGLRLIRSAEALRVNYGQLPDSMVEIINYAGIEAKINFSEKQVCLIQLTKSGRELRNLLSLTENKKYTLRLQELLKDAFEVVG